MTKPCSKSIMFLPFSDQIQCFSTNSILTSTFKTRISYISSKLSWYFNDKSNILNYQWNLLPWGCFGISKFQIYLCFFSVSFEISVYCAHNILALKKHSDFSLQLIVHGRTWTILELSFGHILELFHSYLKIFSDFMIQISPYLWHIASVWVWYE